MIEPPSSVVAPVVLSVTVEASSSLVIVFETCVASKPKFSKLPSAPAFASDTAVI